MSPSGKRWMLGGLLAVIAATAWYSNKPTSETDHPVEETVVKRTRKTAPDREKERAIAETTAKRGISDSWEDLRQWLDSDPAPGEDEIRDRLLALRIEWTTADPQALAEAIRRLLESGDDAPTGLEFKVGNHGFLTDWPTLRVFLLDVLAAADPEMAKEIAGRILDQTDSADEYAVGLRSLTRQGMGRADDTELLDRFDKMLGREDWRASRGFAEAMDLARFVGTADAAMKLAEWEGNPRLKSMAMNEFAAEHPGEAIEVLGNAVHLDPPTRASLMARADPEDPAQVSAVDAYLRDPALTNEEAALFLKIFPLRSATTGYRLYGKTPSPYSFDRIAAGDRKAAEIVNAWAADPALQRYRPELRSLQERLSTWVEQAK